MQSKMAAIHLRSPRWRNISMQGWANRTLYSVFLINWRLTALLLCSTQLCSALLSLALCFEYCQPYSYVIFSSRAVVRSLLSRQCGPGPNPGVDEICELSLLLVLSFAPRGFSMHPRAKVCLIYERTKGKFPGEHHVDWINKTNHTNAS